MHRGRAQNSSYAHGVDQQPKREDVFRELTGRRTQAHRASCSRKATLSFADALAAYTVRTVL